MLFEATPKRVLAGPLIQGDLTGMFKSILENGSGLLRHPAIRKPDHEFVINIDAARIEIGRSNVYRLIDNKQFRMENLRLVFLYLDSGSQQPGIQTLSRETRDGHVCFSCQDEFDFAPALHHARQLTPELPWR